MFVLEGTPVYYGVVTEISGDELPVDIRRALSKELWGSEAWEYTRFLHDVAQTKLARPQLEGRLGQSLRACLGPPDASVRPTDQVARAATLLQSARDAG